MANPYPKIVEDECTGQEFEGKEWKSFEEGTQEERARIAEHLDKLLKYTPIRTSSLRRELGKYVQTLKGEEKG